LLDALFLLAGIVVVEDVVHASSLAEKERGQERELNNWFIGLVIFLSWMAWCLPIRIYPSAQKYLYDDLTIYVVCERF
jgi:hypothetical protein